MKMWNLHKAALCKQLKHSFIINIEPNYLYTLQMGLLIVSTILKNIVGSFPQKYSLGP